MATRSLLRAAARVAIGTSNPAVPWFDTAIPRAITMPAQATAAPTTTFDTGERTSRCLPLAEKEKPPPCERTTRLIGSGGRFQGHHPATVAVGIAVTGALLLTLIVVGHRALPHRRAA